MSKSRAGPCGTGRFLPVFVVSLCADFVAGRPTTPSPERNDETQNDQNRANAATDQGPKASDD